MRLTRAFSGLAALILGLSLSPATAATLVVDNFSDMGTAPASSNNFWFAATTGAIGGARDLSKNNGGSFQWGTAGDALQMTSTVSGNNLELEYDGNVGNSSNLFLDPRIDASTYNYLCVVTPDVAFLPSTTVTANITWFPSAVGGSQTTSSATLTGGPTVSGSLKFYEFKLADLIPPANLAYIGKINLRLQDLGIGVTTIDSIFFSPTPCIPEPGTLALAGLGLVGLVIARRKKSA